MANTFTYRLSREGVSELGKEFQALGEIGDKAIAILEKRVPGIGSALTRVQADVDRTREKLEQLGKAEQEAERRRERAAAAQQEFNTRLGVGTPANGNAAASAAVFEQEVRRQEQLAQAARNYRDQLNPLLPLQRQYREELARINAAAAAGLLTEQQRIAAMQRQREAYTEQARALATAGQQYRNVGSIVQQAGYQIGDFAVQVASGQGVLRPLIQQGTQVVSMFGPWGAAIGAAGAVVGALVMAFGDLGETTEQARKALEEYNKATEAYVDLAGNAEQQATARRTKQIEDIKFKIAERIAVQDLAAAEAKRRDDADKAMRANLAPLAAARGYTLAPNDPSLAQAADVANDQARRGQGEFNKLVLLQQIDDIVKALDEQGQKEQAILQAQAAITALTTEQARQDTARNRSLEQYIRGLEDAARLDGLTESDRKVQAALIAAQNKLLDETGDLTRKLDPAEKQRITNAVLLAEKHELARKAIKQQLDELNAWLDAQQEMLKGQGESIKADTERTRAEIAANDNLEDHIRKLEDRARIEAESTTEKKVQEAIIEAQNKLYDRQGDKLRDLTEEERERVANAVRAAEYTAERIKLAEKAEEELRRAVEKGTDRAVDKSADILYDTLTGKITSIGDFLRETLLRAVSEAAAEMVLRPLIQPLMQQAIGAASTSGFGAAFGLSSPQGGFGAPSPAGGFSLSSLTSWLPGLQADNFAGQAPGAYGPFAPNAANSFSPLGALGAALAAAGAGYGLQQATGSKALGALGGAGSGALLGFQLAGPWGAAAGGVAGLLGGLFGNTSKSVGANAGAYGYFTNSGGLTGIGSGADNGGNAAGVLDLLNKTSTALQALSMATGASINSGISVSYGSYGSGLQAGVYDYTAGRYLGGLTPGSGVGQDAEAAAARVVRAILAEGSSGLTADLRTALGNSKATTLEGLGSDVEFARGFQSALRSLSAGIADLAANAENAARDEVAQLTASLVEFKQRTRDLGLDVTAADAAAQEAVKTYLGLKDASQGASRAEAELAALRGKSAAAADLLKSVGLDPALAGDVEAKGMAALIKAANDSNAAALLALNDPLSAQLAQLEAQRTEAVAYAAKIGADVNLVEQLYGAQRVKLVEQANAALVASTKSANDNIKAYLAGNAIDDPSLTAAQRLAAAQAQFGGTIAAARAGDVEALARAASDAEALRAAGQANFGTSTSDYAVLRDMLRSTLGSLVGFADGTLLAPGGFAWTGERGPELSFVPRGSTVLPSDVSARLMRGGGADMSETNGLLREMISGQRHMLAQLAQLNDRIAALEDEQRQANRDRRAAQQRRGYAG